MPVHKLFHATSLAKKASILRDGLQSSSCLTTCEDTAEYFGIEAMERDGCDDYVVFEVTLSEHDLKVDYPAFEEPISTYYKRWAKDDRAWWEGIENGSIPYPDNEYDAKTALNVTTCVRAIHAVKPENLKENR